MDGTLSGFINSARYPRVAAASKPWAGGCNRVAVENNSSLVIESQIRTTEHGGCLGWRGHQRRRRKRIRIRIDLCGQPTYTIMDHENRRHQRLLRKDTRLVLLCQDVLQDSAARGREAATGL